MDVGGASRWAPDRVVSRREILDTLAARYGPIASMATEGSAPAERFTLPDGTVFGIISSTTEPFCRTCDRSRLTADGMWFLCLYATRGLDLRAPVRQGASPTSLRALIREGWQGRDDRGAEDRLAWVLNARLYPCRTCCAAIPISRCTRAEAGQGWKGRRGRKESSVFSRPAFPAFPASPALSIAGLRSSHERTLFRAIHTLLQCGN